MRVEGRVGMSEERERQLEEREEERGDEWEKRARNSERREKGVWGRGRYRVRGERQSERRVNK